MEFELSKVFMAHFTSGKLLLKLEQSEALVLFPPDIQIYFIYLSSINS